MLWGAVMAEHDFVSQKTQWPTAFSAFLADLDLGQD